MTNERIVYSAVAVPGEPDTDGEILTPEEIRHAAHAYLKDYRIVDPDHVCALGQCKEVGHPVESYLTTEPMSVKSYDNTTLELPVGTWIIGIDVFDEQTRQDIQKGVKKGVSLTGKRADGVIKSRVLIRDLGPNWVARTVSIVKDPAVPKARFFSIKGISDNMTENQKDNVTEGFDRVVEAIKGLRNKPEEKPEEPRFVTHEELESTKSEILEAIKAITPEPTPNPEEGEGEGEGDATKGAEMDEKDKRIKELEAEVQRLKSATKSKGIPDHLENNGGEAVKNLYLDDGRDCYGRVIKQ